MEKTPRALLLKFPGTNCDGETRQALEEAGFSAEIVLFDRLGKGLLEDVDLVVLPGGFSYGDYVMAGRMAELKLKQEFGEELKKHRDRGGLILGICNGFQILLRLGLLPDGSLIENTSGTFHCGWVELENRHTGSVFLQDLPDKFQLPVAHAEGRFVTRNGDSDKYLNEGLVPLQYVNNPNGSVSDIAALQDETGRVLGMMPHPERFYRSTQHYDPAIQGNGRPGWGHYIFRSAFESVVTQYEAA